MTASSERFDTVRVFKNARFHKFAGKEKISDKALCEAVRRAEVGLIDADLGVGVLKQRVARPGSGRSGGFRTIVFFRAGDRAVFAFGFAKNDRANIDARDERELKEAAKVVLALSEAMMDRQVAAEKLEEVMCDAQAPD